MFGLNWFYKLLNVLYWHGYCRYGRDNRRVYTFSSPPTVIEAPRIRVSPPRSAHAPKKPVPGDSLLQPGDKNLPMTDDSGTECDLDSSQTSVASVSAARLESGDNENLLGATTSRLSPMLHSVRRSSLREIPEDEIRRSGASNILTVIILSWVYYCMIPTIKDRSSCSWAVVQTCYVLRYLIQNLSL